MKSKRWLVVSLSLPIIVLLGWFLYEQILIWATPVPHWIASKGQHVNHCRAIEQWFEAEPVEDTQAARITRPQAGDIAQRVLARHHGFAPLTEANGSPRLVRATFPDGRRRLAWYEVVVIDDGGASLEGKATVVYLDALTGEPLMLIPDVGVGDPCMACGCPAINLLFRPRQFVALGLLTAYLLILAAVGGVVWLRRRLVAAK
jgi:hypothetical protein